jgi:hypothetical protein
VNGLPGIVIDFGGEPVFVVSLGVEDGLVREILMVANPDKLAFARRQAAR